MKSPFARLVQWLTRAGPPLHSATIPAIPAPSLKSLRREGATVVVASEQQTVELGLFFEELRTPDASVPHHKRRPLEVAAWLETRIVPVLVSGHRNTVWLLVARDFENSDELREVAHAAVASGYVLHPDFQVVVMAETLLLAIRRGKFNTNRTVQTRRTEHAPDGSQLFGGFRDIVRWGYEQGAADIDFRCSRRDSRSMVGFSIAGRWIFPERFAMPTDMMREMLGLAFQFGQGASEPSMDLGLEQQLRIYLSLPPLRQGGAVSLMLRWASMAGDDVYCVTCRLVVLGRQLAATSLQELGYLPSQSATLQRALIADGGAIVLSGVVNSGKSTTISTLMGHIPATRKIVTLEDPVEFVLPGAVSNTIARPLTGAASPSLAAKLRTLKRTGFNDLLLGEIRDQETAAVAQDVFESGQKLFTTVHTGRAWMIPERLAGQSIGIPREVLATPGNLRLLANQSLLPRNCPTCKLPFEALISGAIDQQTAHWRAYGERLRRLYDLDLDRVHVRNPAGCSHCRHDDMPELSGFAGRTTAAEMIEPDEEFCRLVAVSDSVGMLRYLEALRDGTRYDDPDMVGKSAMDCAIYKVSTGEIDPREVEPRFTSFETVELVRQRRSKQRQGMLRSVGTR